jgi:hypothetical protein
MTYDVIWDPDAEQELARLYMSAPNPQAVTNAADQIDLLLAQDPVGFGESREDPLRILIVLPLGVNYQIDEDHRTVEVRRVWRF